MKNEKYLQPPRAVALNSLHSSYFHFQFHFRNLGFGFVGYFSRRGGTGGGKHAATEGGRDGEYEGRGDDDQSFLSWSRKRVEKKSKMKREKGKNKGEQLN